MNPRIASILLLGASVCSAPAAVIVQELFDGIGTNDTNLNGWGDGTTSLGMTGTWVTNGNLPSVRYANNFNVNGNTLPGLPSNNGSNGGVWQGGGTNWSTDIYTTRSLATTIDFGVNRVLYFSVRLNNGGDSAMGVGLASGKDGAAQFVGAGLHWDTMTALDSQSAANAAYIAYGTLGQNLTGNNDGVYAVRAHEAAGSVNGFGLLVGRITIHAAGPDVIDLKRYAENSVIDNDLTSIAWSASASVNSSMVASNLLLWMNGSGGGELDAIRFGDTWTDVTGVSLVPESSVFGLAALGLGVMLRRRR
ncbi:MAG: hypothetical protein J0M04_16995 [Verrucomicrobia bacterium]|nr:hypothetical protein [Verrucomicrobiota bacterium]